jgi:hypothetical protein
MKTNNVPALVMLSAGLVDCVIAIKMRQPLWPFTRQLLLVLIIFYILGSIIRVILDRSFQDMDDLEEMDLEDLGEPQEMEQEEATDEEQETDDTQEMQE